MLSTIAAILVCLWTFVMLREGSWRRSRVRIPGGGTR